MRRTKTTEIIVETDEVFIIRQSNAAASGRCCECGGQVELISPEIAAAIFGAGVRSVYRLIEASLLHFSETQDGRLLVCLNSLSELETRRMSGT
jgi:hypothetical protein